MGYTLTWYTIIQKCKHTQEDFKTHELPLARIKKIMRLEDDVAESGTPRFMIAAEAPIIIAKACEIFVLEVSTRCSLTELPFSLLGSAAMRLFAYVGGIDAKQIAEA